MYAFVVAFFSLVGMNPLKPFSQKVSNENGRVYMADSMTVEDTDFFTKRSLGEVHGGVGIVLTKSKRLISPRNRGMRLIKIFSTRVRPNQ